MSSKRTLSCSALFALALLVAGPAWAGKQMYQGAWIAESFGNDNALGKAATVTESDYFSIFGMPQGLHCNPYAPVCPIASSPFKYTTTGPGTAKVFFPNPGIKGKGGADGCVAYTYFGSGPRPAKGPLSQQAFSLPPLYRNTKHFTGGGNPRTTSCFASTTIGGKYADTFLTFNDAKRGLVMKGAPVSGTGVATTTLAGPGGAFVIPAAPVTPGPGGMFRTTSGSFGNTPPYLYSYTYATFRNDAGSFAKGNGFFSTGAAPTTVSISYSSGGTKVAYAKVTAGANRFGGVMRLFGKIVTKVCYFSYGGCNLGGMDWRYEAIGATAYGKAGGVLTAASIVTFTNQYRNTALGTTSTIVASGSRFPWTTGAVTVEATGRGPHNTIIRSRAGYDNRTSSGQGMVQLVTPVLTRWLGAQLFETGGVGILRIQFVPEPQSWAMLVAGLSALGVLYRFRGR